MKLEIRVPISPTPAFVRRVILLAASVREFYADTRVIAYIGQPTEGNDPDIVMPLAREGILFDWVTGADFAAWAGTRAPFLATMNRRFATSTEADYVLIADADVICCAHFAEELRGYGIVGMQAHVPPMPDDAMQKLFAGFLGRAPTFVLPYSGAGLMCPEGARGPWYVNSGAVLIPGPLFERLRRAYQVAIRFLRGALHDAYWFDQLALALAVPFAGLPAFNVGPSFNFPNQPDFDAAYPGDLARVRFIHYLRTDVVDRDRDFADDAAIARFLARRDLAGSNEALRRRVAVLHRPAALPRTMHVPGPLLDMETAPHA